MTARFLSTLPARGATIIDVGGAAVALDFYPRSPRGERHDYGNNNAQVVQFLSTLPARGATRAAST